MNGTFAGINSRLWRLKAATAPLLTSPVFPCGPRAKDYDVGMPRIETGQVSPEVRPRGNGEGITRESFPMAEAGAEEVT